MKDFLIFLRPGVPMYVIGASILILSFVFKSVDMPTPSDLIETVRHLSSGGYVYQVLFIGYLIEGIFVANFYWPGSFILFAILIILQKTSQELFFVWVVVNVAAAVSLSFNIFLGVTGMYRLFESYLSRSFLEIIKGHVSKSGVYAIFLMGFHINWLSVTVTYASALNPSSFIKLLMAAVASHMLWSIPLIALMSFADVSSVSGASFPYIISFLFIGAGVVVSYMQRRLSRP